MKVKEITDRMAPYAKIVIQDRLSEEGTVYDGDIIHMRTVWDEREVAWIRLSQDGILLEIE